MGQRAALHIGHVRAVEAGTTLLLGASQQAELQEPTTQLLRTHTGTRIHLWEKKSLEVKPPAPLQRSLARR